MSRILHEKPGLFRILLLEATSIDPEMTRRITDFFDWCARQVDAYFENVGGQVFDAVAPLLNTAARIPLCGLIAQYNATSLPEGPDRLFGKQGTATPQHHTRPNAFTPTRSG